MNQVIKIIITIFVAVASVFTILLSFGMFLSQAEYLHYDLEYMIDPVLVDADIEYLGETYQGMEEEGSSYYLLTVSMDNQSNYGREDYGLSFRYSSDVEDEYFWIREVYIDSDIQRTNSGRYLPAGKKSKIQRIICVEDGCKAFDVIFTNYRTDKEQKVHVEL